MCILYTVRGGEFLNKLKMRGGRHSFHIIKYGTCKLQTMFANFKPKMYLVVDFD